MGVYRGGTFRGGITITRVRPPVAPVNLGESYKGGYFGGLWSSTADGTPTHFLIVAPVSTQFNIEWDVDLIGSISTTTYDGITNTTNMYNAGLSPAITVKGLTTGGYTDWYIPSQLESDILYKNLKPEGENGTSPTYGVNAYQVWPQTANVTRYVPNQTYASNFTGYPGNGAEKFLSDVYWTSTQDPANINKAYYKDFTMGSTNSATKYNGFYFRAIRREPYFYTESLAGTPTTAYRYWRWYITYVQDQANDSYVECFVSQFRFQWRGLDVQYSGVTMSGPGVYPNGTYNGVYQLVDNSAYWQFENWNHYITGITDIRFDFGTARSFTSYRWMTNESNRNFDPRSWTVQASTDNTNWVTMHTVSNYNSSTTRFNWEGPWEF